MRNWPSIRLEECCEIVSGATPSTSEPAYWDGDICWATPKDLSELQGPYISDTPRKLTRAGLKNCAAAVLPPDSVLFSSRAPIGHIAVNTVPMATNQGFKSFVPKRDRVHAKFLYHWLRRNRPYLESLGNGATFKEVSKAVVSRIEIALPPLPEQRRIAEVLDRAEVLRAKRRAALARLDTLTQAIFLGLFGDCSSIPGSVEQVRLEEVTSTVTKGTTPTSIGLSMAESGIPFVRVQNLADGVVDPSIDPQFISDDTHRCLSRSVIRPGDLLVSIAGTIGRASLVSEEQSEMNCNQAVAIVRPNERVVGRFLLQWMREAVAQRQMRGAKVTGTISNLSLTQLRNLRLELPPLALQRDFARRVAAVEKLKAAHRASLVDLDALFSSLQHRAFRGEL